MLTSETAGPVPFSSLQRKRQTLRRERPGRLCRHTSSTGTRTSGHFLLSNKSHLPKGLVIYVD